MRRTGLVAHQILVERQILNQLKTINPVLQPSGEDIIEGMHYQWHAKIAKPFQLIQKPSGLTGMTTRKLALFTVHVDLMLNNKAMRPFDLLLLGWK